MREPVFFQDFQPVFGGDGSAKEADVSGGRLNKPENHFHGGAFRAVGLKAVNAAFGHAHIKSVHGVGIFVGFGKQCRFDRCFHTNRPFCGCVRL